MTLFLEEYTLFVCANLCYPTTRLRSYFSTLFAAHLRVYTRTTGCKRSFACILKIKVTFNILCESDLDDLIIRRRNKSILRTVSLKVRNGLKNLDLKGGNYFE